LLAGGKDSLQKAASTISYPQAKIKMSHVPNENASIVAVVTDLMFIVKIQEAAKRAHMGVTFVKSQEDVLLQARSNPAVIILDLNTSALDPLELITTLKSDGEFSKIPLLGYVSHVQGELIHAAQEKGCDTVVARSAFSQNLPSILGRYV
jgi:CheY-like chemotaxis protein